MVEPTASGRDAFASGFASFFSFVPLTLATPLPDRGEVVTAGWIVRFVVNGVGEGEVLDFFATHPSVEPIHGQVDRRGDVTTFETFRDHVVVEPGGDPRAAEDALDERNARVQAELVRKGLL